MVMAPGLRFGGQKWGQILRECKLYKIEGLFLAVAPSMGQCLKRSRHTTKMN